MHRQTISPVLLYSGSGNTFELVNTTYGTLTYKVHGIKDGFSFLTQSGALLSTEGQLLRLYPGEKLTVLDASDKEVFVTGL